MHIQREDIGGSGRSSDSHRVTCLLDGVYTRFAWPRARVLYLFFLMPCAPSRKVKEHTKAFSNHIRHSTNVSNRIITSWGSSATPHMQKCFWWTCLGDMYEDVPLRRALAGPGRQALHSIVGRVRLASTWGRRVGVGGLVLALRSWAGFSQVLHINMRGWGRWLRSSSL